jgi:hypothetical protein
MDVLITWAICMGILAAAFIVTGLMGPSQDQSQGDR